MAETPTTPLLSCTRGAFRFELLAETPSGLRRGRYHTPHGSFETPCFAPVGTYGTLRGLLPETVRATGAELILANAYHLELRPGADFVRRRGGLHRFMSWDGPILTDSGGYQVFSLAHRMKLDDEGVTFQAIVDGTTRRMTPQSALEAQRDLGPDIAMVLDECPPGDADEAHARRAHARTLLWAEQQRELHESWGGAGRGQAVFGIVQGGVDPSLRVESARALVALDFDGYAIGGLSVGETKDRMAIALDAALGELPRDRLRYLMGVGTPEDFEFAATRGVDLFDCVTPTRHARNNQVFTRTGRMNMRNRQWAEDDGPIDPECACYTCRTFSRAYLRHLAVIKEPLSWIAFSVHNIHYFQDVMRGLRERAEAGGVAG
jgi:queuine tRNA-ribosyltransferase